MSLLITILIGLVILAVVFYLIELLPFDLRLKRIINVVIILIFLVWIIRKAGIM